MKCEHAQENLPAYLHHELSGGQAAALQTHLTTCEPCRGEMEAMRGLLRGLRQAVPVEPSASARLRTQQTVSDVISGKRRPDQLPAGASHPQWEMLLPSTRRSELPHEPRKALPAPGAYNSTSGTVSDSAQSIASATPSSRRISARLEAPTPRTQFRSILRIYALFTAILLVALALLSVYVALHARPHTLYGGDVRNQRVAANFRWDDRHTAKLQGKIEDVFIVNNQLPLNETLLPGGALYLVPHDDSRSGEVCLVGYRETDLQLVRNDDQVDQPAFNQLIATALKVTSPDGKADLPPRLIQQCFGADSRASILVLRNRIEIWPAARLERYLATDASFKFDGSQLKPATNGLPSEQPRK